MVRRVRTPIRAVFAACVWVTLAGSASCGSDEDSAGSAGAGGNAGASVDGSSGASGAGASSGGSGGIGGAVDASDAQQSGGAGGTSGGNGVPDSVPCGTATCSTVKSADCESSGGCYCCVIDSTSTCNLYGHPCAGGTTLYCDGPEDCDVGQKCCGQFSSAPAGALCAPGCGGSADELCGSNADCSNGQVCTPSPSMPSIKICG